LLWHPTVWNSKRGGGSNGARHLDCVTPSGLCDPCLWLWLVLCVRVVVVVVVVDSFGTGIDRLKNRGAQQPDPSNRDLVLYNLRCVCVLMVQCLVAGVTMMHLPPNKFFFHFPVATRPAFVWFAFTCSSEVFGGEPKRGFRLTWLLPTPIYYPDAERLTGYCFREPARPRTLVEEETFDV
jgi:hypothetical protein